MSNWTHEIWPAEDPADGEIEFEKLSIGSWIDLEIVYEADGRFFIQATNNCDAEIDIGTADTLDAAKKLAERWAIDRIADMFKALGAEGIWLVRDVKEANLFYRLAFPLKYLSLKLELPIGRILLARFPAGDGGEPGIEHF